MARRMITRQRGAAVVAQVGAGGSPLHTRTMTLSLSAVSRTMHVRLATGSSYGVLMMASLLMQTFCGCGGGQFDG